MATSSIFASFDINDKETAEAFVKALDISANDSPWKPLTPIKPPLTNHNEIQKFWSKRKSKK